MSPVRFLVKYEGVKPNSDFEVLRPELRILKCMINNKLGIRRLYIVETNMLITVDDPNSPLDYRNIAYKTTTKRNSVILDSSKVFRSADDTRYLVSDLSSEYHTLGECMYAKLFDWCAKNKVTILGII